MRHKYQHVYHQYNDDLYETLHPSSPLEPKCRLEALFSLLSDLFFWPFRGIYWNPGRDSSQRPARRPSYSVKGLIGLMSLVFVGTDCKFWVGDLDQVVHTDPQRDDKAQQSYKTDRQGVNFKNGFLHQLVCSALGRR